MKVISVINKKGGVGKTTSTGAIASICAGLLGMKVLCLDLDPQCNLSELLQADFDHTNVEDLMYRDDSLSFDDVYGTIQSTPFKNIDVICGSRTLDDAANKLLLTHCSIDRETKTINVPEYAKKLLSDVLDEVKQSYDIVLIDNTPFFNLISENALSISNAVLIPVQSDGYSYTGLIELLPKIYDVRSQVNQELEILGVYFSNTKETSRLSKATIPQFRELGGLVLRTIIRPDAKASESNTACQPAWYYNRKSNMTLDFMKLLAEIEILDDEKQALLDKEIRRLEILKEK